MEIETKKSFKSDEMCRLCLNHFDAENAVNIFDTNDLSIRIMACAGLEVCLLCIWTFYYWNIFTKCEWKWILKVTQQDALPKQICLECRLVLEKSFLFRNKCKSSDTKLRRHFRLINAGKGKIPIKSIKWMQYSYTI